MLIDVFIIQSFWCGKPKVILKLCNWCNFSTNLHLLNHNLPFCSVRCDRALNRWMNENSYLEFYLSCKLLKFGATLASVTAENYLVWEDPVKALYCVLKSVKLGYHCCILVPGGHCRLRLKMFCPGFPNACWKSSFDADCSGSCMPVVFFVQGKQNLKEQFGWLISLM